RRAFLGEICFRFLFGFEIDRGAVIGRADSPGEECPVVARIVPGQPAGIITVVPKGDGVLDRVHRLLAIERNRLAVRLDLPAAPRPEKRIPKDHRIAESMAEGLAIRAPLGLELLAHGAVLVPSVGKLTVAVAHLVEPRLPVREQPTADAPRDADPFLAIIGDDLRDLVIAALCVADLLSDVADIDNAAGVKLRP